MNNFDTRQSVERPVDASDFVHLIWLAFFVAIASAVTYVLVRGASGIYGEIFFGCVLLCSAMATVFVGNVWAVLGPSSYLKRLFWSHAICAIVGLGHFVGLMLFRSDGLSQSMDPIKYVLLGVAPISLAAQIPVGFFRVFFGWQFALKESPPAESFLLRDVFVFTFLVALGFAGPQLAINLANNSEWFDPTSSYEEVTAADGTVEWEEVVVTDQAVIDENVRNFEQRNRNNVLYGYAGAAAWAFGISLLSLPIPLLLFGMKGGGGGWFTFGYAIGLLVVLAIILTVIFPWDFFEIWWYFGLFVISYVAMVSLAFAWSVKKGFRLTSPRGFSRETAAAKR